jgi:GPH family glycoside/pentoside/hexuronide:cation symporter
LEDAKLSPTLPWFYAVGHVGLQQITAAVSFFLLVFLTDVARVPPALAGSALLIGKLWDVVNDPLFGWLSDRARSPHGRRRVFLIYGAAPLALTSAGLWCLPAGLSPAVSFVWIAVAYTLFDTFYTAVAMPYTAMSAELTHRYDDRTRLAAVASLGALLGYLLGSVAMPILVRFFDRPAAGYAAAGSLFGLVAGACIAVVAWRVPEPPRRANTEPADSFLPSLEVALRNRLFRRLLTAFSLIRLGLTLIQASLYFYLTYVLGLGRGFLSTSLFVMLSSVGVCIPLWRWAAVRWNKHGAYAAGMGISGLAMMSTMWIPPGGAGPVTVAFVFIGVGMAAHWVIPLAMLPDVVEEDRSRTGSSRVGVFFGVYGLADKIMRTLGSVSVGWVLGAVGYVPDVPQTRTALWGVKILFGALPAGLLFLAVPFLWGYPLHRRTHDAWRG